jgi:death on curing protein
MTNGGEPWAALINVARVIETHDRGLADFGGLAGPANPEPCVEAALGAAFNAEMYLEGRRHVTTGLPFAAYLLFYLARRHCFTDGNKRVAWACAMDILAALGLGVTATDAEAVELVESILSKEIDDGSEVAAWLSLRLFAI